jgi:sarcosine oxidase, subunit beta
MSLRGMASGSRHADAVIVGAGIVGLFVAYALASRGMKALVLERMTPGSGSSTRNGGGVRSQWGTATNIALSAMSRPYWVEFEERFGADVGLREIGYLFLASTDDDLETLGRQVALQREFGVASEILAPNAIAARWPSLRELELTGASFCGTDGFVNQHRVIHGMVRAVEAAGGTIESGVDVTGTDATAGRITALQTTAGTIATEVVVNCAGAWAPDLAEATGVTLPIRGRRVQLMLARPSSPLATDLPWLIDARHGVHIRQDVDGRALLGGFLGRDETVDPHDFNHDADGDWIAAVLLGVQKHLGIHVDRDSVIKSWAGLYPSTPDQHPIIDRTDAGMVVVGGFAGAGLMHAPGAGLLATELILDGRISSLDPAPLSLERFTKPTESVEQTGF